MCKGNCKCKKEKLSKKGCALIVSDCSGGREVLEVESLVCGGQGESTFAKVNGRLFNYWCSPVEDIDNPADWKAWFDSLCDCIGFGDGVDPAIPVPVGFQVVCKCLAATGEEHDILICKLDNGSITYEDLTLETTITAAEYNANYVSKDKPEKEYVCEEVTFDLLEGEVADIESLLEVANSRNVITAPIADGGLGGLAEGINSIKYRVVDKKGVTEEGVMKANGDTRPIAALDYWSFEHDAPRNIPTDFELKMTKGCATLVFSVWRCVTEE